MLFLESSVTSPPPSHIPKYTSHHALYYPDARERCLDNPHASTGSSASAHLLCCLTSLPVHPPLTDCARSSPPSAWLFDLRGTQSQSPLDSFASDSASLFVISLQPTSDCLLLHTPPSPLLHYLIIAIHHPPPASCEDPPDPVLVSTAGPSPIYPPALSLPLTVLTLISLGIL